MKNNLYFKLISTTLVLLLLPNLINAQCKKSYSVYAGSSEQTYTSSGAAVGYTQVYSLENNATGLIVETNTTGVFNAANFTTAGTSYKVYALNYNGGNAPDPLPSVGAPHASCGSILPGCKNPDFNTDFICVNVIACTDICQGTDITASSSGATPGYLQEYLLVNTAGNIVAIDNAGAANFNSSTLAAGSYTLHAFNYNPGIMPVIMPAVGASAAASLGADGVYDEAIDGCFNADYATDFLCFTIASPPNAGSNNAITVCSNELTYNVFGLLSSAADVGGIWASTSSAFNVATGNLNLTTAISPVSITYTVSGGGICPDDVSTFVIAINTPNNGITTPPFTTSYCLTSATTAAVPSTIGENVAANLVYVLTQNDAPTYTIVQSNPTGAFNLAILAPSTYVVHVLSYYGGLPAVATGAQVINAISTGALCAQFDAAVYTITIDLPVDAGTPILPITTINNCATGTTLALNTLITGETTGGFWVWNVSPTNPLGGTFVATPGTFNPIGALPGAFSFTYNISNGACTDNQNVTLNVVNCPVIIVATNDAGITTSNTTTPGVPITIAVLDNDIFPVGVTPTIVITTPATDINGTYVISPSGAITFTPNPGFIGVQVIEYFITDPTTGSSSIAIISIAVTNIVSIALSNISAASDCEKNIVTWTSQTENMSLRYEIYRSLDAITFTQIGSVAAAGNSATTINYVFDDYTVADAKVYYKVLLVLLDGTRESSDLVVVTNECKNNVDIVNIRPNPTNDILFFDITSNRDERINLVVLDVTGRVIANYEKQLIEGKNSLSYETSQLAAALYFIGIRKTNGENVAFKKFTKINH